MNNETVMRMARECFADPDGSLALLTPELSRFAAIVSSEKDKEIERLRGEVARLDKACQYHANNASELGRSLENLEHDYAAMKAERDAARGEV